MQHASNENADFVARRSAIVVPLDFSPVSIAVARLGALLAHQTRARLVFCHAIYPKVLPFGPGCPPWIETALRHEAIEKMQPFVKLAQAADLMATCVIEEGPPTGVILKVAQRYAAQLIILTSRRSGVWPRLFFGSSVAEQVGRQTECQVMVARFDRTSVRAAATTV